MNNIFIINNIKWNICLCNINDINLRKPDGTFALGCTDRNKKTVYICKRLKGNMLNKVILHEICHCCIFSYGIYLTLEQEEYLCDFVSKYAEEIVNLAKTIGGVQ